LTAADRKKWNDRFAGGAYSGRSHPTALLARHIDALPRGRALDVACGAGRNALFLASRGYAVDAVDIAGEGLRRGRESALDAGVSVNFIEADLDDGLPAALAGAAWDLIVLVRYINTPLIESLCGNVAPGGALVCEEHLASATAVSGPRSRQYRVAGGELLGALSRLEVRYYREGLVRDPDGERVALAQAIVTRGGTFEIDYC